MKSMLQHSFVLDALESTGGDTFSHFEMLIDEHLQYLQQGKKISRLKQLVPTVGSFHTHLPLRKAFEAYNIKYSITKRRHICISFNEIRHILNLAQIMALVKNDQEEEEEEDKQDGNNEDYRIMRLQRDLNANNLNLMLRNDGTPVMTSASAASAKFNGPKLVTFDGDQTLYSDGSNFESNLELATYLYLLLKQGVYVAVVTAAGYEYASEKYELRLSGLLTFFKSKALSSEDCKRFFLFGGECNYLLQLGPDYKLHAVNEHGENGWMSSTISESIPDTPANWKEQSITALLDTAEISFHDSIQQMNMRATLIRKKRSIGVIPKKNERALTRESLDETILRVQAILSNTTELPYCAFNGGRDVWVDVGNKRVGVQILQSYCGVSKEQTLHIGDQFLNTGNDTAARDVCPCVWIINPEETTYILKNILRLAGIHSASTSSKNNDQQQIPHSSVSSNNPSMSNSTNKASTNFEETLRRDRVVKMDVYTGEFVESNKT